MEGFIDSLIERIRKSRRLSPEGVLGYTEEEMCPLLEKYTLPALYVEFMRKIGKTEGFTYNFYKPRFLHRLEDILDEPNEKLNHEFWSLYSEGKIFFIWTDWGDRRFYIKQSDIKDDFPVYNFISDTQESELICSFIQLLDYECTVNFN